MPFLSNPSVGQIQPLPASYPRPGQVVLEVILIYLLEDFKLPQVF
jgi:hypothetical protein